MATFGASEVLGVAAQRQNFHHNRTSTRNGGSHLHNSRLLQIKFAHRLFHMKEAPEM